LLLNERKNSRGKIEILACVLEHCQIGLKKTHIMLRANLGYEQLCYYLPQLVNSGLVMQLIECGSVKYRTTEAGREYLENYYNIVRLIKQPFLNSNEKVFPIENEVDPAKITSKLESTIFQTKGRIEK
jgi:predicted transcriptional regulator